MIRFKCIYCGQKILAKDDGIGKKGKCPKCKHDLVVPKSTKGRPAISADKEPMPERLKSRVPPWGKDSRFGRNEAADELAELEKEAFGFFIPTYDELSLFLMAVTLILLYMGNSQMRGIVRYVAAHIREGGVFIFSLAFLAGLGLCLYHVFTSRGKTSSEKIIMMLFAVVTNAGTGIIAGWYVIKHSGVQNWLLIFPVWNIINGVLLLLMLRFRIIDEECIADRDATAAQVIIGLTAILIIFIFCNSVFRLHWAITFSICIIYTTSFDRALQSVFPGIMSEDIDQHQ
ncbi:MAG: hypothetical protein ABII09_01135 [Planctomycetota bacterium]